MDPFLDQVTTEISTIKYNEQEKRERIEKLNLFAFDAVWATNKYLELPEGKYKAIEERSFALYHFLLYGTPIKNLDQNNPKEPSL